MMAATVDQNPNADMPVTERGRVYDPDVTDDERTLSLVGHLTAMGHLVFPGLAILAPIIIWASKKDDSPYIADHMKEAMNFQITLILYTILIPIALFVIGLATLGMGFLLFPIAALPYVLGLVGVIMAAMAANRGEFYRYPMTFRLVR